MLRYELHDYSGEALEAIVTPIRVKNEGAARGHAGRLAKKNGGPVDLAKAGTSSWKRRYITTAAASEFHKSGYRFERLS